MTPPSCLPEAIAIGAGMESTVHRRFGTILAIVRERRFMEPSMPTEIRDRGRYPPGCLARCGRVGRKLPRAGTTAGGPSIAWGVVLILALCGWGGGGAAGEPWSDREGGDHGGADWQPPDGAIVGGVHLRVATFRIAAGATVTVVPFDGAEGGRFVVHADAVEILGTLSADGAGYRGGRGGGEPGGGPGGGGAGGTPGDVVGGSGAGGGHGGAGGLGYTAGAVCTERRPGPGDGAGYPGGTYGADDETVTWMGSGGGAAGLSEGCANLRGPGAAGGGAIRLRARRTLRIDGLVSADGARALLGDTRCGYRGGGGGGAGGGVFLQAASVELTGRVRAAGGAGGSGDGLPLTHGCNGFGGGGGGGGRILVRHGDGLAPGGSLEAPGGAGGRGTGCGGGHGLEGEPGRISVRPGGGTAGPEVIPESPRGTPTDRPVGDPAIVVPPAASEDDEDGRPLEVPAILAEDLKRRLDRGDDLLVVFVGFRSVYEQARIPGAQFAEWSTFDAVFADVDRNREIVLYCDCCSTRGAGVSGMFVHRLRARGFLRAMHLDGHFAAWKDRGLPVESDR